MQFETIEIFTHSGFKADERPTAFIWRGKKYLIADILDRWYEGGLQPGAQSLNYFKVLADDSRRYIIRYNALFDAWAIEISASEI